MFHKKTSFACYVGCVYLLQVSTFGAPKIFARGLYKTKKVAMTSLQPTNIFLTYFNMLAFQLAVSALMTSCEVGFALRSLVFMPSFVFVEPLGCVKLVRRFKALGIRQLID